MAKTAQFPSLDRLQTALCDRSKLFGSPINEELLSSLKPTPYDAFQRALEKEGAKEPDIQQFLHSLKALKYGRSSLLTKDGLIFLSNTIWQLHFEVRRQLSELRFITVLVLSAS